MAAHAGRAGLGLPAHPGGPRDHRHRLHPADLGQALVGLPEPLPLAAVPLGQAGRRKGLARPVDLGSSLLQLFTGFCNVLGWYPFRWDFIVVHYALAWVVIGSVLLHVGIKLPDINYGLRAKLPEADVLTEIPWNENPDSHSNAGEMPAPPTPGISRRGLLAVVGTGLGLVAITVIGQALTPLERIGLLAPRQPSRGPQGLPVGKTAAEAQVGERPPDWQLEVAGPQPYALSLADLEELAVAEEQLPFAANEGWSAEVHWRGVRLLDLVQRAGGTPSRRFGSSRSNQGDRSTSRWSKAQLSKALLATHLNGERISLDHGYPLRLIVPNRAGLFNTKWLTRSRSCHEGLAVDLGDRRDRARAVRRRQDSWPALPASPGAARRLAGRPAAHPARTRLAAGGHGERGAPSRCPTAAAASSRPG